MALSSTDRLPQDITLPAAYQAIRQWYQANQKDIEQKGGDHANRSGALIAALPDKPSDLEIRAVLGEIIYGNLELAYHQSDGKYKMAAYAHAALRVGGYEFNLSEDEKAKLKSSKLWNHLSISR